MRPGARRGIGAACGPSARRGAGRTFAALAVTAALVAGTLWLGTVLPGRWYYLTATLVVVESMLPFFARFEARRPQARELALVATMAALAAASRVAFALVPWVKPIMGVIMVAGAAFGAETGFLVGALAALISNFFFSQGPWTPWQMMAYGVGGLLAGLVFRGRPGWCRPVPLAFFGFASVLLVVGPLLDASTLFTTASVLTWPYVLAVFAAGLPANATLAVATGVTLLLVGRPLLAKLERLRVKYGLLE